MSAVIVFVALFLVFLGLWGKFGGTFASAATVLFTLTVLSQPYIQLTGQSAPLRTIATPWFGLTIFQFALILAAVSVHRWAALRMANWWIVAMAILLVFVTLSRGEMEPHVASGIMQWLFVALAWGLGSAIAAEIKDGRFPARRWVWLLFGLIMIQAIGVVLQMAGLLRIDSDATEAGLEGISRLSGFTSHAAQLGKLLIMYLVMLLPFSRSTDAVVRRLVLISVIASSAMIGVTYSRANTVALVLLLILWFLVGSAGNLGRRLLVPILAFIVAVPTLGTLLLRQELDEAGGSRPELLITALHQIGETFWWGVGPNNYLQVVGQYDRLAAAGLPVHNSALLMFAEVGAVASLFLIVTFGLLIARTLSGLNRPGSRRLSGIAVLAAAPGLILILTTGQGMTVPTMFPVFMLMCGYCYEMVSPKTTTAHWLEGLPADTSRTDSSRHKGRSAAPLSVSATK